MEKIICDEKYRGDFLSSFQEKYPWCECGKIGRSILTRDIHYYKIGEGSHNILCVGAHHALEYITSLALFNFIDFLCENKTRGGIYWGVNLAFLLQKFTYWVVPCMNPDGVELYFHGIGENPLSERQRRMCGGEDFSEWQANARGVDLNHNYKVGFAEYKVIELREGTRAGKTRFSGEYPESEPETASLANFVRSVNLSAIVSLHTQGREIYYKPLTERVSKMAERLAVSIGYRAALAEGTAAFGGLSDYTGEALGIPSFTVELGYGKNPLPDEDLPELTESLRKLLITLPTYL